jgi:hypothetical protein
VIAVHLSAPYHQCTIDQYPGFREFIFDHAAEYPMIRLRPVHLLPTFNLYTDDDTTETLTLDKLAPLSEILAALEARGVLPGAPGKW